MNRARAASASRIGELAVDPRFDGRQSDLKSLAQALSDDSDTSWTGIDLIAAFPADATISVHHRQILERVLGVLAGISVFLPVAWTWFSLHSATQAYNDLLASGQEKGRTFLAMWTEGFDGRLGGAHQLVPMALVSFALVLFAVACIVLHRLAAEINVHREDKESSRAHRDLVTALLTAQRLLNERRSDDPRFLEAAVERSVKELNKAHLATRKGVEAMQASTQNGVEKINEAGAHLTAAIAPLLASATTAGTNLAASAASAADAEKRLSSSVAEVKSGLADALEQFHNAVTGSTSQLTAETTTALSKLAEKLEQVAAVQTELARQVAAANDANRASLAEAAETGRRTTTALADATAASMARLADATSASTAQLADRSNASLTQLSEVIRDLHLELQAHASSLQAQVSELSRNADLSSQILSQIEDMPVPPDDRQPTNGRVR